MSYLKLVFLVLFASSVSSRTTQEGFIQCMSINFGIHTHIADELIHSSNFSSYSYLFQSLQQNPRWVNSTTRKPLFIITPFHASQIQASVLCSKKHGLQIRVRSGGHDYEGQSYLSKTPFILIDLINFRSIKINMKEETAWVQSGATLGELYYSIAKKSNVHGFPGGLYPSIGVGGHISGGGFGTMLRKYGLAADNVVDAFIVDVNGNILNRRSMGKNLFWAIRGGGGATFGIILSWKVKLVRVPPIVTVFSVTKSIEQGAITLVHKWQSIGNKLPKEFFIRIVIQNLGNGGKVEANFNSLFLGDMNHLLAIMNSSFPELRLQTQDCMEMNWIQSVLFFIGYQKGQPLEVLLDRITRYKSPFKAKSDFVNAPIPKAGLRGIWKRLTDQGAMVFMIMDPFGGRMDEISESEIAFPHRKGNLYNVQYLVKWEENSLEASYKHIEWIRKFYMYMAPYVKKSPRAAYVNYRDLDLGTNRVGNVSFLQASAWGMKYFKGNFKRLALVKGHTDPDNFFKNEQSIPPYVVR